MEKIRVEEIKKAVSGHVSAKANANLSPRGTEKTIQELARQATEFLSNGGSIDNLISILQGKGEEVR
jgi:hypothetical protein